MVGSDQTQKKFKLRSQRWFDDPDDPGMTSLYLERMLNFGMTRAELQSGRPIIGIAQTGSDIAPCNRHHIALAERVKAGIRDAGGVPLEFPVHPIQETLKRPTAALDRNLQYLSLVEILHGYPLDGSVLTTGCDLLIPAEEMAARRKAWSPPTLVNKTPWEEIYRAMVGQAGSGGCLEPATLFLNILETRGESRHNH